LEGNTWEQIAGARIEKHKNKYFLRDSMTKMRVKDCLKLRCEYGEEIRQIKKERKSGYFIDCCPKWEELLEFCPAHPPANDKTKMDVKIV
jgi:hypothetical protein